MKVLGVIPARFGSKGIPQKNIVPVRGRPLISYMIRAARACSLIDELIVSTESEAIARIAEGEGAKVPFLRPEHLARDDVSAIAVNRHALRYYSDMGKRPEIVVSLQPTSPLVSPRDIDRSLRLMMDKGCDSCFTMKKIEEFHPSRMYAMDGDRVLFKPYTVESNQQRQDYEPVYKLDGAVIARRFELLENWQGEDTAFGNDRRGIVVPWYRGVDVNETVDLLLVEAIMERYDWLKDEDP